MRNEEGGDIFLLHSHSICACDNSFALCTAFITIRAEQTVHIVKAAWDIFKDAIDKMVHHACDEKTETEIRECVMRHPEVRDIDLLQTRLFGNRIHVDLEICVDGCYTLQKAYEIAEQFPKVKHIMVHVNPENK